jgi:ABC-type bacteriocin/lantibiotic exporter with double-glycine peptidase domain
VERAVTPRFNLIDLLKRKRTAIRPQFQTTECGVGVLRTILAYYGSDVPAHDVRKASRVSRDCLNAGDLRRAAIALGMLCSVRSVELEGLRTLTLPVIVHLRFIHFVVLESINDRSVTMNCPAAGRLIMPVEEFSEAFTGIALSLTPGPDFQRSSNPIADEPSWWQKLLATVGPELAGMFLLSAVRTSLLLAIAIALGRSSLRHNRLSLPVAAILLSSLGVALLMRRASRRVYRLLRDRLANKLEGVPNDFYVYRLPDVLARTFGDVRQFSDSISGSILPAVLALIEATLLLAGCMHAHLGIGSRLTTLFLGWSTAVLWLTLWRRHEDRPTESSSVESSDAAARGFKTPEHVRLGAGPHRLAQVRAGMRAAKWRVRLRVDLIHATLARMPFVLLLLALLCVCPPWTASGSHVKARLLLAGALSFIAAPLTRLRGVIARVRRQAFGIRDVLDEPLLDTPSPDAMPSGTELRLEGVTFRFNLSKPPILRDATLTVTAGEQVGITGASGGGKSTATEIMMGIYEPENGRALLGGVRVSHIPQAQRSRLIARVDRRPVLFEATLRENFTLGDPSISQADLECAVRDAALAQVIDQLPNGLDTQVEFEGRNFSGGQLQRIEIARALARNPSIVILDDAVDALDFEVEMQIRTALRRRNCTVICVGHRASSLAACDRLVIFRDGQFHETPTPQQHFASPASRTREPGIFHTEADDLLAPSPSPPDAFLLQKCWQHLLGRTLPEDLAIHGETAETTVHRLASSTGTSIRNVRFTVGSWWHTDVGLVLAFRRDGSPVALTGGRLRTRIFDPQTNTTSVLTRREARTLRPDGYALLRNHEYAQRTLWARTVRGFRDARQDAVPTVLFALCAACCTVLLFVHPERNSFPSLTSLLIAALLFGTQAHAASERAGQTIQEREEAETDDLTVRVDADAARTLDIAFIFRALQGLSGLVRQTSEFMGRSAFALALVLLAALCLKILAGGRMTACALGASLACGLLPLLASLSGLPLQERSIDADLSARRRLFATMRGTLRLRSLHRFTESLADWKRTDDQAFHLAQSVHQAEHLLAPLLLVAPALAVACVLAKVEAVNLLPSCAAFVWLMAFGFVEMGQWLSGLVVERTSHRAARNLLALPFERGLRRAETPTAILRLQEVAIHYAAQHRPVLAGLSLSINPQQMTVLAGASGSGKSTLLRLLLGLQHPAEGEVSLNGISLSDIDLSYWRRGIAGVFQGDSLEEAVTIRAQLNPNQDAALAEVWDALRVVEMADEIQAMPMGVQTIVESGRISSGQQQRLLIARALLARPSLLVLDEATNAIPDAIQARIFARIRERRIGCLVVSHRESVWQVADVVYVLREGAIDSGSAPGLILRHKQLLRSAQEVEAL